jgi:hypothetical protein
MTTPDAMLPTFQDNEPLESQVNKLANFILDTCPDQIEGGAIETAVKIIAAWNRRAGQAHAAALLEALRDQIDGCSMIVQLLSGQKNSVAHSLRAMLNAQIDDARAAIVAAKGA